jgi:hypothetical protein
MRQFAMQSRQPNNSPEFSRDTTVSVAGETIIGAAEAAPILRQRSSLSTDEFGLEIEAQL